MPANEPERFHCVSLNMFERGAHGIRDQEKLEILFIDRTRRSQMSKQILKRAPILGTDQHDRKVCDLAGLNQRQCLEELVGVPSPPGSPMNAYEYLKRKTFRTKKYRHVME